MTIGIDLVKGNQQGRDEMNHELFSGSELISLASTVTHEPTSIFSIACPAGICKH